MICPSNQWGVSQQRRVTLCEEAQQRRLLVVFAEAAEEFGVGEGDAPSLADGRGAGERGWLRRRSSSGASKELSFSRSLGTGSDGIVERSTLLASTHAVLGLWSALKQHTQKCN
jgi:hypothetical protein